MCSFSCLLLVVFYVVGFDVYGLIWVFVYLMLGCVSWFDACMFVGWVVFGFACLVCCLCGLILLCVVGLFAFNCWGFVVCVLICLLIAGVGVELTCLDALFYCCLFVWLGGLFCCLFGWMWLWLLRCLIVCLILFDMCLFCGVEIVLFDCSVVFVVC